MSRFMKIAGNDNGGDVDDDDYIYKPINLYHN
jgi:hypothetical protein